MTKYISVSADAGRPGLVETARGHTVADKYFSSTCDTGQMSPDQTEIRVPM